MSSRRAWVAVASAWLIALAALLAWLLATSTGMLREELRFLQFWSLEVCVLVVLAVGLALTRDLLHGLRPSDWRRMAALAAVALGLTLFAAPRTNRIYYDEQIYQGVGQNLADLKLAQMCNDGTVEYGRLQCWSGEYNKQPYAYPHLLSLAYRAFGVRPATAFVMNAGATALTACLLYLLVFILFSDRQAAFFAGLLVAFTPQQLIWSATAAVEPSSSLAAVAALLAAAHASRSKSLISLTGAAVAAAYAVQFRPESLLILPVAALLAWRRLSGELARPGLWWIGLLFLGLVATHVGHLFAVRGESWGTNDARLSLRYVSDNLRVNGWFYFGDARFPLIYSLLAIVGLAGPRFWAERAWIALYFLVFFGIGLLFYAGSYNYGADVRYSLMTYPPVAVLGGLGAARIARWLERLRPGLPAFRMVTFGLAFQFLWYMPLVRATTEEAWAARADVRFAGELAPDLRGNAYVLTHNPGMFHLWGVNAGQMSTVVANPSYLPVLAARYTGGLYVHWNFWCNVHDQVQQELCRKVLELRPSEVVREYRERDQRFALYRFTGPPP
jgi:4-amino-4-deoxy-L-arabinose transferase-like glycosyltransferase